MTREIKGIGIVAKDTGTRLQIGKILDRKHVVACILKVAKSWGK
jgi:hypothetical protein